jgi:hypothetical protein
MGMDRITDVEAMFGFVHHLAVGLEVYYQHASRFVKELCRDTEET